MNAGPKGCVIPCPLIVCKIPYCKLVRDGIQNKQGESERKPCRASEGCVWVPQSQEQIWCYRNSNTESTCLTQWMWQSHIWALEQIVWRTSQAASVPTKMGYKLPERGGVTDSRALNCSFVHNKLKTHTSSRPCTNFYPRCLHHIIKSFIQRVTLSEADQTQRHIKSLLSLDPNLSLQSVAAYF